MIVAFILFFSSAFCCIDAQPPPQSGLGCYPPSVSFVPTSSLYVKYSWPHFRPLASTPLAMDVTGDGLPEIFIFDITSLLTFCGVSGGGAYQGYLWAIGFENETLVTMWSSIDTYYTYSTPAVAKLPTSSNNNTTNELFIICALHDMNSFNCLNALNGSTLFTQTLPFSYVCPPSPPSYSYGDFSSVDIVSLYPTDNTNGIVYLLVYSAIYKLDCTSLPLAPTLHCGLPHTNNYQLPHAVDIDLDGIAEVLYENCVYNADCSLRWCYSPAVAGSSGVSTAVANIDSDPESEVIFVSDSVVYALDHDATLKWSTGITSTVLGGGPPTVNDFNNDGIPDVGVATYCCYFVLSGLSGGVLQTFSNNEDSPVTGSVSFDFDNDGNAEFIDCDVSNCHIFGMTTSISIGAPGSTGNEHAIVVDVDFDGTADIVTRTLTSLLVINSVDSWYGTVRQWNTHAYGYGNIDYQGYPQLTRATNTFRANPTT